MSSLLVTIDRTGLSLSDLVISGLRDANELGLVEFAPPGLQARLTQVPDSGSVHGTEFNGGSWQQAILGFYWMPDQATNETEVQAAYAEVAAAIGQFAFPVTTQVGGAPAQVWDARMGSIQLAAGSRSYADLEYLRPVYAVSIPVYPIPGAP